MSQTLEPARPLLTTKLHPPPPREQMVLRDRLVQRLAPRPEIKLTLIAAPAGSGKTTLLGMWRALEEPARPVAWVSLDEGDNDPVVFWSYVVAALRGACPTLELPLLPEQVGLARLVDLVLPELVNELTQLGDAALVLDDFHRISSGPARESFAWFIDHAPSTLQLVLATRSEPALPLSALRAHGALLEVRAEELGFTPAEADVLLNDRLELSLEREYVDHLVERTEGWPAGLYLAALSLQGVEDRHTFVSRFGSQNRHVVDFLVDEVLDAHEPDLQDLLLRSSVLERLSGPLCDAVLEQEGAREQLHELARTNLFLVPLDDHGEWYRFHQLFAQLLRVELEHRYPGVATELHRRAYRWHRDYGSISEAIRHAVEARAFADATRLIGGVWLQTVNAGRYATVLGWLRRFTAEQLRENAALLLIKAWVLSLCGEREEAVVVMAALERLGWSGREPLPDGSTSLEGSLAMLRAAFPGGDVALGHANGLRAVGLQTPESPSWPAACWPLGMACYYRGDFAAADRWFAETVEVGRRDERWVIAVSALAYRSLIAGDRGDLDAQARFAEQALRLARDRGINELDGEAHVAMGASLAAGGELVEALPFLARGVAVARSLRRTLDLANALIRQAAAFRAMARHRDAAAAIAEAVTVVDSCADPGILRERLEALERRPRPRSHRRDARLSERELVILRMLRGPLSERDISRELYLSHNTVHSHTRSIYRKLGVSSRAQALQRALILGLL